MKSVRDKSRAVRSYGLIFTVVLLTVPALAQTCFTADDMDAPTRSALQAAASRYFDMVRRGDAASLKQNSIPSVANSTTVKIRPQLRTAPPLSRTDFM